MNAKNPMGGYVGARTFLIFIDERGAVTADMVANWVSTCDGGQAVPVQPELQTAPIVAAGIGPAPVSMADELGKFAKLRDNGIITEAEFQTQKAKLLPR